MAVSSALLNEFLVESFENLGNINNELTRLESNPNDSELLNSIYRAVHTLKGSANFLGFKKLQEITHSSENILDFIRSEGLKLNSEVTDTLLQSFDSCIEILRNIEKNGEEGNKDYQSLNLKLNSIIEKFVVKGPSFISAEKDLLREESKSDYDKALKSKDMEALSPVKESVVIQENLSSSLETSSPQSVSAPTETESTGIKGKVESGQNISDSVVKVNVKLLDKIMNTVGELVLNRNQILQFSNTQDIPVLNRLTQQLNSITSELQADIMTTRMQPVGSVLNKFERVVRDLARQQGKKIKLKISGQETELDKTLIEAIKDPLTHLIRNCADHGIESPDDRKAKNKNEEGTITIRAYHEGGQVNVEICDDGKGIDPQKIIAKALEKGLITSEQATIASANDSAAYNLIFLPGFSTAEKITNISGRGVGMDVVKTNIEKVGGQVSISSKVGEGSVFKLKIPLTLAIIPALIVSSMGESFAIPQINLVELVRLGPENLAQIEKLHESEFFRLRGEIIPLIRLNNSLNLEEIKVRSEKMTQSLAEYESTREFAVNTEQIAKGTFVESEALNIVVVNAEDVTYGIIVDEILDTEEIVVKSLGKGLKNISVFAGATIMGNGQIALIIDVLGLLHTALGTGQSLSEESAAQKVAGDFGNDKANPDEQELLLFTLQDNRTYGVPLSLVNRLEEFSSEKVEFTGGQSIVRYRERPVPLINLEKTLKLSTESKLNQIKPEHRPFSLMCFMIYVGEHYFGLVVNQILDIALTSSQIDSDVVDRDGILGAVFVGEKTVSLIDIYSILELQKIGTRVKLSLDKNSSIFKQNQEKTILLVDDSPLYRKMESDALIEQGYKVVLAVDGLDAIKSLEKLGTVDLIISDIEMPNMNGFELAKAVKEKFKNIPILALSTRVATKDLEDGKKAGFNFHLEKFKKEQVLETVSKCLGVN